MHGREDVSQFFERRSSALVDAAIACAKATGYARYTTTIRAAWVEAVASVNEGLAEYLPRAETDSAEPKAQVNYAADPRFVRMREVAERHRGYGATLQLYLGFLKHFRELYLEVLGPAGGDTDKALARDQVRGFFDLAELSIAAAWADVSADVRLRDLQARNRAVTLEKDRYFSVFESLRDPAFLLDRERRLITGNQAAAELFVGEAAAGEIVYLSAMRTRRLPLEEALSGLDLWNPDRPEGVDALWLDTRLGRLCFDLRVRQLHDSVENMRLGYVAILHDVTEHRRATDEAQRAQRAMSQFLATMSHEIRTPLHGVLGATELLHDAGPDEFDGYLDAIEVAGRHLLQTLNKVLDYSRLEARPPTPTTRPINLHAALSDYRGFAATLAQNAGVAFHLKRSARLPKGVEIDWEMTQQVLTNLVSNAVRYSRGAVTLTVGRRAGPPALLRFEVADDGPGVAPEVAKTLFEPFGAVTPGRGATSGSGLGLAISRRLVTAMGGKGNIINVLEVLEDPNTVLRKQGIEEVVAEYPDVTIIQEIGDIGTVEEAVQKVGDVLSANIDKVDGIIATGYTPSVAIAQVLGEYKDNGGDRTIHAVGIDTDEVVMQAIKDGIMDGTIVQNPYGHGYLSMLLLQYLSEGYKPKADAYFVDAGFAFATQENLETYNDDILAVTDQIKAELLDKYLEK